jgi:hypothetical protein
MRVALQNVAWFPKIIVTLGIVVACTNVLLMPLDVSTQNGSFIPSGIFPMNTLILVFFVATIILFFVVLPFTYFYYEGWSEDEKKQSVKFQARSHAPRGTPLSATARLTRPGRDPGRVRPQVDGAAGGDLDGPDGGHLLVLWLRRDSADRSVCAAPRRQQHHRHGAVHLFGVQYAELHILQRRRRVR